MASCSYFSQLYSFTRLCIILFLAPICLFAQEYNWKAQHISIENGLSNRFLNAIIQDNRGFMWAGTNFGLNRYDGHRIDILTRENNKLQSNTIQELYLDYKGMIWIAYKETKFSNFTGVDVVDPVSFEVRS
ncbi:MAG: two-component regulator propeller domain-containing protein, partial [Saprospiraceae bacterium]